MIQTFISDLNLFMVTKMIWYVNLGEETVLTRQKPLRPSFFHVWRLTRPFAVMEVTQSLPVSADWKTDNSRDLINTEHHSVLDVGAALTDEIQPCLSLEPWQARRWSRRRTAGPFCSATVKNRKWGTNMDPTDREGVDGQEEQEIIKKKKNPQYIPVPIKGQMDWKLKKMKLGLNWINQIWREQVWTGRNRLKTEVNWSELWNNWLKQSRDKQNSTQQKWTGANEKQT